MNDYPALFTKDKFVIEPILKDMGAKCVSEACKFMVNIGKPR